MMMKYMKTLSVVYMLACLGFQQLGFRGFMIGQTSFLIALSLPAMFALQGMWVIYMLRHTENSDLETRKIYFWWMIGFIPISLFIVSISFWPNSEQYMIVGILQFLAILLFFIAIFRIIWIGVTALSNEEKNNFGRAKIHPFLTGLCFFYLILGMFFLDKRIKALKS